MAQIVGLWSKWIAAVILLVLSKGLESHLPLLGEKICSLLLNLGVAGRDGKVLQLASDGGVLIAALELMLLLRW